MMELETLQNELKRLPRQERLKLAHWLLDSLVVPAEQERPLADMASVTVDESDVGGHPLLRWAGLFSGGPGDTAERDEEILEAEVDKTSGWGHP